MESDRCWSAPISCSTSIPPRPGPHRSLPVRPRLRCRAPERRRTRTISRRFAYTPRFNAGPAFLTDGRTVVRGGFRVSYDETYNNVTVNQTINAPWNFTTTQRAGTTQPAAGYGWNLAFDQNIPLI